MIPTQIEALTGIVDLCVWSPVVREAFQQSDAEITLSTVARRRDAGSDDGNEESTRRLFLFSRRALLASQDNQVHDLGKVLIPQLGNNWRGVQWCKVDDKKWGVETVHAVSGAGAASTEWKVAFTRMLSYLRCVSNLLVYSYCRPPTSWTSSTIAEIPSSHSSPSATSTSGPFSSTNPPSNTT